MNNEQTERKICAAICQSEGLKAREIARKLDLDRNTASELFEFASIGKSDFILPVCSGDMLFNVFDEYLGFLYDGEEQRN